MGEQMQLLAEPPSVACTRTLADLVGEVAATGRVPLWAQVAGEAWFARAWATCNGQRTLARLAWLAFARDVYDEDGRWWVGDCLWCTDPTPITQTNECATCAALAREIVGEISLAIVRCGLDARSGR
jgi:hypothetical protein